MREQLGPDTFGDPLLCTVSEVRQRLDHGNTLFTFGADSWSIADVEPYDCAVNGSTVRSIRSVSGTRPDANLDDLLCADIWEP